MRVALKASKTGGGSQDPDRRAARTWVDEWPKGSICQPIVGTKSKVLCRNLRGAGWAARPARVGSRTRAATASEHAPVPARRLVDHRDIVRRRLIVLHVAAVDEVQLQRGMAGDGAKARHALVSGPWVQHVGTNSQPACLALAPPHTHLPALDQLLDCIPHLLILLPPPAREKALRAGVGGKGGRIRPHVGSGVVVGVCGAGNGAGTRGRGGGGGPGGAGSSVDHRRPPRAHPPTLPSRHRRSGGLGWPAARP